MIARAKVLGYSALAITDECSLAGVVRAHVAAKQHGLKLIIGTEVQIEDGPKLVLLATDREGYGHISALITRARMRAVKGRYRLLPEDLEQNLDHCLVLLVPPTALLPLHGQGDFFEIARHQRLEEEEIHQVGLPLFVMPAI